MPFNIGVLQGSCVSSDDFAKELQLASSARDLQIVPSVGEPRRLAVHECWTVVGCLLTRRPQDSRVSALLFSGDACLEFYETISQTFCGTSGAWDN